MITLRPAAGVAEGGTGSLTASDAGREVGRVVRQVELGVASVSVVESTGDDRDADILDAARRLAVEDGATAMTVEVGAEQVGLLAMLQNATVLSTFMVKPVPDVAPELPTDFDVRAMTADEYATWRRTAVEAYAADNLARCGGNRELALQRSHESYTRFLPDDAATVDTRLLTLVVDGDPAGDLWIRHHWPRYRDASPGDDQTFTFDVHVAEDRRGRGLGRAAMLAAERYALEVGDGQLGLNVFGGNTVAVGLYRSLGYAPRTTVFDVPLG